MSINPFISSSTERLNSFEFFEEYEHCNKLAICISGNALRKCFLLLKILFILLIIKLIIKYLKFNFLL